MTVRPTDGACQTRGVTETIVELKKRGFISLNAHPAGCAANVAELVDHALAHREATGAGGPAEPGEGCAVILGASTGYGLASTIAAAFTHGLPTLGVCLERPPSRTRTATAGWYNVAAVHDEARARGATVHILNADCFAHDTKRQILELAREHGPVRLLVNSIASPVRTDPDSGETYRSVLKPVGQPYVTKSIRLDTGEITTAELEPATDEEVEHTRRVMGGEDWALWIEALDAADVLADDFRTVAYTYIGPEVSHPIYRSGSIGQTKAHLEATARDLAAARGDAPGGAWTSVNGAAVTQASAAIPTVPLYLALLMAVTRDLGVEYQSVEAQILRLFDQVLRADTELNLDDEGRIRVDDWELDPAIQAEIARRWELVTTENLHELGDFARFEHEFDRLFGFGIDGVDYAAPVEVDVPFEGTTA